jgi:hypothetical protein
MQTTVTITVLQPLQTHDSSSRSDNSCLQQQFVLDLQHRSKFISSHVTASVSSPRTQCSLDLLDQVGSGAYKGVPMRSSHSLVTAHGLNWVLLPAGRAAWRCQGQVMRDFKLHCGSVGPTVLQAIVQN